MDTITIKTIAEIVSAFGTLIIAGIVAYIAYRQHRTDKSKFRLDLYDRRQEVFGEGMKFVAHVSQRGDADDADLTAITRARLAGIFLFPKEIPDYYSTLYKKGVDLQCINKELNERNLPVGEERSKKAHERGDLAKWFSQQFEEMQAKFRPYMEFEE